MVQVCKKNEVGKHKNELKNTRNELPRKEPKKEEIPKEEMPKEEITKEEITKEEASEKTTLMKRKPSLQITFHNPNSDETITSYLIKVLGERLADEIRKETCT